MIRITTMVVCLFLILGCSDPNDPGTPKGAFAMIGRCINQADRKCFFKRLDRDSRWSVATVHRTLVEIRRVAEKSYPRDEQKAAFGIFGAEAKAASPEELFAVFCKKRKCLEKVARKYGSIQRSRKIGPNRVEVTTSRGGVFEMVQADGKWGLDILSKELQDIKIRLIDRLKQVRVNAKQFEEQRLAR